MRMSKSDKIVESFLKDLSVKLGPLGESDIAAMLKIKEEEVMPTYVRYLVNSLLNVLPRALENASKKMYSNF